MTTDLSPGSRVCADQRPPQAWRDFADRRLPAGEAVDVVPQRERQVDAMHQRVFAIAVEPAAELDDAQNRELVAAALGVERAQIVERDGKAEPNPRERAVAGLG